MGKDFNEFIDHLYSDEIVKKWEMMEKDIRNDVETSSPTSAENAEMSYGNLYNVRWTLFVVQQYHEWINA